MAAGDKKLRIDLISDIHIDRWAEQPEWQPSAPDCDIVIVAGDVADNLALVKAELERIAQAYKTVLFIDGNHEYYEAMDHEDCYDPAVTEDRLRLALADIPNAYYLKDSVFIRGGVAIVGRNGFWDHHFAPGVSVDDGEKALAAVWGITQEEAAAFTRQARQDFEELRDQVQRLNNDPSIHTIVVVTHTVPHHQLVPESYIKRKPEMAGYNGNSQMEELLAEDKNKKIRFWLFGHMHMAQEQTIEHVEFISHPRGARGWSDEEYKPRPVDVDTPPLPPPPKTSAPPSPEI